MKKILYFLQQTKLVHNQKKMKKVKRKKSRSTTTNSLRSNNPIPEHQFCWNQSKDGDVIGCADIYNQLAFEHPALGNHLVQMEPSSSQTADTTTDHKQCPGSIVSQVWKKNRSCPKGTIPIPKSKQKDILQVYSVGKYGRKESSFIRTPTSNHNGQTDLLDHLNQTSGLNLEQANHLMAAGLTVGYSYSGAKTDINIWQPTLESDDKFSSAEIWLLNDQYYNQENIKSRWAVSV